MNKQAGFTLLEVTIAMVITVAAGSIMMAMLPTRDLEKMQVKTESRRFAQALKLARQSAIAKQTQVRVRLSETQGNLSSFVIEELANNKYTPIGPVEAMGQLPAISASSNSIEFFPTGSSDQSLQVKFGTRNETYLVSVIRSSGMVRNEKQ
jgi:Tfp pilus assembly protein FimT